MKWSWKIARVGGIDIRIHATLLLLLAWIAWAHYSIDHRVATAVDGVLLIVLLFTVVVLHELGHALMARRFGIRTRDITLLPIGGVARLERMPREPRHELLVAVAGPAVNVVLAAVLFLVALLIDARPTEWSLVEGDSLVLRLAWINVALAVFNLIPAFPMDGGRVFRALLAMRMEPVRATWIAARLGQGLALILGFIGLLGSPVLLFIALFVWLGAESEARAAEVHEAMDGVPVAWMMVRDATALSPHQALGDAVEISVGGFQHDFPVVERGRLVGMLSRADLLRAVGEHGLTVPVSSAMRSDVPVAHPAEMLEPALERLGESESRCLPVVDDDGRIVGVLTLDGIGELLALRSAVARGRTWRGARRRHA